MRAFVRALMPTPLTRPVTRVVTTLRGAPLNVTLAPDGIRFREPRRRTAFVLPYGVGFLEAVERHVAAEKRARVAERRARRAAKGTQGGRR